MKKLQWLFCVFVAVLGVAQLCHVQAAQSQYPSKPVRLIIPFAPGGGVDIAGRFVGAKLTDELGQSFIADNRSGAGGP